jgi:signal transduction histidine kinase
MSITGPLDNNQSSGRGDERESEHLKLISKTLEIKDFIARARELSEALANTMRTRDSTAHKLSVRTEALASSSDSNVGADKTAKIVAKGLATANNNIAKAEAATVEAKEAAAIATEARDTAESAALLADATTVAGMKLLDKANEALADSEQILLNKPADAIQSQSELSILTSDLRNSHEDLIKRTAQLISQGVEVGEHIEILSQFNSQLLRRSEELGEVNKRLVYLMSSREGYVAALTHDLKNPLIGCNQLLQAILDDRVKIDQQPEYLRIILDSTTSMLRMIWNLLATYKDEHGQLIPSPDSVDIAKLLESCVNEFTFRCSSKNINVTLELAADVNLIQVDEVLLRRVLVNLLDNAVKFSRNNEKIRVTLSDQLNELKISVIDTGRGISKENLEHIFEQFWQCERTSKSGTGLGLSTSKQIMHVLGGRIECSSTKGVGTEFNIFLPTHSQKHG